MLSACVNGHTHNLEYHAAQAPTCSEKGHKEYWQCTVCGGLFGDEAMTILYGKIPSVAATEEHTWSEWTGDFDCTKGGEQTRNCTVCGLKETRTLPAGHTWGEWEQTIAPGCTLAGEEHRLCTMCNEEQVREVGALGHSLTYVSDVPATCTSGGVKEYYHCTLCDEDFLTEAGGAPATADELRIEPLGHTVKLIEKAEPTCTQEGVEQHYKCTRCGALFEDAEAKIPTSLQALTISANGHAWGEWIYPDGYSCDKGGVVTHKCSVCGHEESQTIAAGEHTWAEIAREEATCEEDGYVDYKCSFCGTTKREDLVATGHNWGEWEVSTEATCTEAGEEKRICENCEKEETQVIEATGHSWGEWVTAKQPTCTQEGEQERTCANCNHKETQPLSELGHDMQHIKPTAATCTQAGNIEYYYCNRCGKYFSDQQGLNEITGESIVTPALNHNWGEWVTDKDATCEESGHRYRTCTRCDSKQEEAITATGHSYNSATHVCANCGDIQETQDLVFALASPEVYPGGSYVLTSTGVNRGEIVLPATYEGKPVTGIASGAVLSGVTSVQIPNTQTFYIYGGALASTVTRVNYLGDIDGWAQLYFESGWAQGKYTLYTLSGSSFAAAKDVTISCDYIATYAFENNGGLGSVTLDRYNLYIWHFHRHPS